MRLSHFVIVRASFRAYFVAFIPTLHITELLLNFTSLDWVLNAISAPGRPSASDEKSDFMSDS